MSIKVHSEPFLSRYTDNRKVIEINGETVRECLNNLVRHFPRLELFDKNGNLFDYYTIVVNSRIIFTNELDTPVTDGDEISIDLMIAGG